MIRHLCIQSFFRRSVFEHRYRKCVGTRSRLQVNRRQEIDSSPSELAGLAAPLPGAVSFPEMKTKKPVFNPFGRHQHAGTVNQIVTQKENIILHQRRE